MKPLRIAIALLALLLCAAHLLRWGGLPAALLPLLAVPLVCVRRNWAAWTLRGVLVLAALEWLRASWMLAAERQALGLPFLRMLAILLGVVALTAAAAWLQRPPEPPAGQRG